MVSIAFFKANGPQSDIVDWVIDIFTHHVGYSHVEMIFSDGVSFSSSPRDGGCRFKQIEFLTDQWTIVPTTITSEEEVVIRQFCENQNGKKYDWLGAIGVVVPDIKDENNRWFCTEVLIAALHKVGVQSWINPAKESPNLWYLTSKDPNAWVPRAPQIHS